MKLLLRLKHFGFRGSFELRKVSSIFSQRYFTNRMKSFLISIIMLVPVSKRALGLVGLKAL